MIDMQVELCLLRVKTEIYPELRVLIRAHLSATVKYLYLTKFLVCLM